MPSPGPLPQGEGENSSGLAKPAAKPPVEFHQYEIPHPAEESALFYRFHHNQRTLFNRLAVKLEINRPDDLAFFSGAVSCGSVR